MAIDMDGNLWAWGNNIAGAIGDGTLPIRDRGLVIDNASRHFPVKVMESVIAVSAGGDYTMAIDAEGNLWGWGKYNSIGIGRVEDFHLPALPTIVMDSVVAVSAGWTHTLALRADGSVWAWGGNRSGELGDGTTEGRHFPVMVIKDMNMVG